MKELLVNFFYDISIDSLDINLQNTEIIDISGIWEHNVKALVISKFEDYDNIYKSSLNEFVKIITAFSTFNVGNKNIRNFKFRDFPIYWLTNISVKHPNRHWFLNLIIFKNFIIKYPNVFDNYSKVKIITQKHTLIIEDFVKIYLTKVEFLKIGKHKQKHFLLLLKGIIRNSIDSLFQKKCKKNTEISDFLIVYPNNTSNYTKAFFDNLKKLIIKFQKQIFATPYFSFRSHEEYQNSISVKPKLRILKLFAIAFNIILLRISLLYNFNLAKNRKNSVFIFLKYEILSIFSEKLSHFYMYVSFLELSKIITKPTKVFYEDEFYETGRIISKALAKNDKVITFGIQHGAFSDEHTVYNISDLEITNTDTDNAMPIPDKFIVWGDFFKKIFLKNNSLKNNFVIPAGNLTYISERRNIKPNITNQNKVLYCLTTKNIFVKEINIIKNIGELIDSKNIVFRFHPFWKFDSNFIKRKLNINEISISDNISLKEEISNSDIIITSAHSTVFLDAIVLKKPVLRIITKPDSFPDKIETVYNCSNNQEFEDKIRFILENKNLSSLPETELLNLNFKRWNQIISK